MVRDSKRSKNNTLSDQALTNKVKTALVATLIFLTP